MSIKGFQIDGAVQRYDYTALDNKPIADATLSVNGGFADAAAVGNAITTIRNGGSGLSNEAKQALLALLEKVAYVDENGQTYYDALETALYPPANLVSISAVYTQSGTVYDTDSLDALKTDLVVTARMDDGTTRTVTEYTLIGTLAEGTSTITVSYGGKTTTFTVTVSERGALYPLTDGTFALNSGSVTISNGNHIKIEYPNAVSQSNLFINFKDQLYATIATHVLNNRSEWFVIPSGKEVIFDISNVTNDTGLTWQMNFRKSNSTTSASFGTGNLTTSGTTVTNTLSEDESVSCLFLYTTSKSISAGTALEFDVSLTVDGVRYI